MNLAAVEIKAFVPSRDFEKSKQFYLALGFEIPWTSEDLAHVRHGETSFLLQSFYELVCWRRPKIDPLSGVMPI
jgi:hypothetical protein